MRNIPKRLVKAPRLYWRDTGLLHALLGLASNGNLAAQLWVGTSWETWVIEQILFLFGNVVANPSKLVTFAAATGRNAISYWTRAGTVR